MVNQRFYRRIVFALVLGLDVKDLVSILNISVKSYYHKEIIMQNNPVVKGKQVFLSGIRIDRGIIGKMNEAVIGNIEVFRYPGRR